MAAVGAAALVPRLAHRGMFLDGVTYAAIARNLAEGRGRFWEPFYTATIYPAFHEHPPLAFWLQSLWFGALGDRWYVERLYCLAAAILITALIAVTWRAIYADGPGDAAADRDRRDQEWLPILLWMAAPVVSWSIVGNLLETTVCVFVTASIAVIARTHRGTAAGATIAGAVSGLCVAGAVLSKGPVGLFPLAAPMFLALMPERRRSAVWCAAGQWTTVAACAAVLWNIPSARQSLSAYFSVQITAALAGQREVSGSSFTIVIELVQGVWLPMIVTIGLAAIAARAWIPPAPRDRQIAIVFTLIGLSGTLPMLISPKQTGHYLMPAVPFYAIGAAAVVAGTLASFGARLSSRGIAAVRILAGVAALIGVVSIWIPAVERDPALLADLDRIAAHAPRRAIVGICPAANGDWLLHAWMQRRFVVSLDPIASHAHEWFLKSTDTAADCPPASCVPIPEGGRVLSLMRCR
jgi:4-amino-4-deoxy-L-arabinose transferase-like glycosyltransferase